MSESIWKKEISFSRKPKPEPVAEPAPAAAPAGESATPWWKKEVSLSRAPKPAPAPEPVAVAAPVEPKTPWWKKELGPGARKREAEIVREAELVRETEIERLTREAALAVAVTFTPELAPHSALSPLLEATVSPGPHAQPEPALDSEPQPEPQPVVEPAPEPAGEAAWVSPDPAPAPVVAAQPEPAPEPAPEPWLAGPELPPEPQPVVTQPVATQPAAPVVVHPPVPAAQLPSEEPVPFWKKEISLSRKPKAPKAEKQQQAELPPQPQPVATQPVATEPAAPVVVHPPVPAAQLPPEAAVPFWKKEIALSRKPKAPKAAKEPKAPKAPKAAKPPKQPKEKRGRPSLRLPVGKRGPSIVGLKIGASQLAAARISNDSVAELQQVARAPLTSGIVVGGELRDPDALAVALRDFFAANRLPHKGVRLGIASPRIGVRIFDVSGIDDDKQLGNAVRFRAQEVLPIPLDEAVLDYRVLGESVDDQGRIVKRVLLVVAHRELVERYITACRKAGLTLSGIDLEAFALLRSLAPPGERDGSALVAVAIGHERTTLAVSDGRVCEFTRVLEWGGWALNVALSRALDVSPSEVEGLKRRLSLEPGPAPEGLTPEQAATALDAVRRGVESLARELVSSLQFYQGQPGSLAIGEVVITGGAAHMAGLAEELQRLVGVHVRVGNPLNRVKVSKHVTEPDIGSLAVAIGLGIED